MIKNTCSIEKRVGKNKTAPLPPPGLTVYRVPFSGKGILNAPGEGGVSPFTTGHRSVQRRLQAAAANGVEGIMGVTSILEISWRVSYTSM